MGNKLFGTTDRAAAHAKLEQLRDSYPKACCLEDPNDAQEPYQVHDEPPPQNVSPPSQPAGTLTVDDIIALIKKVIAERGS